MRGKNLLSLAICVIAVPLILFGWRTPQGSPLPPGDPALDRRLGKRVDGHGEFPVYSPILKPMYQRWREDSNRTDYVWQIPASPKAVLFLAHGCSHRATAFWDPHPACPTCTGLPEERALVVGALERGYAVIAVSSTDVCWNVKEDADNVKEILSEWIHEKGLRELPVVALGSSTGGYFLSLFAHQFRFRALVLMVAEGRFGGARANAAPYPPVLFVHMPKDDARADQIRVAVATLAAAGVEAAEVRCREVPVSPDFFAQRIPEIDNETSHRMVEVLRASGAVDGNGAMRQDARWFEWHLPFKARGALPTDTTSGELDARLEAHVEEELNVAFGFHEFTSLPSVQIFRWLDDHVRDPVKEKLLSLGLPHP